jgi:hypothetical protein
MMMGSRGDLDFLVSTESSERSLKLEQKWRRDIYYDRSMDPRGDMGESEQQAFSLPIFCPPQHATISWKFFFVWLFVKPTKHTWMLKMDLSISLSLFLLQRNNDFRMAGWIKKSIVSSVWAVNVQRKNMGIKRWKGAHTQIKQAGNHLSSSCIFMFSSPLKSWSFKVQTDTKKMS